MKKRTRLIPAIALLAAAMVIELTGCDHSTNPGGNGGDTYYTVAFDARGGLPAPAAQTIDSGGTVTAPAAPTKNDYDFDGWYKEQACTTAWIFASDTVTANITLYAKWSSQYLSFDSIDGADGMAAYLLAFTGANSADNPIKIALTVDFGDLEATGHIGALGDSLGAVFDALNGKFVALDLRDCTGSTGVFLSPDLVGSSIPAARLNKDKLVAVRLPSTLTRTGNHLFNGSTGLQKIELPATLETIDQSAFAGCTELTTVEGGAGVTTIGIGAFDGCVKLESAANLTGVTGIAMRAFRNCEKLNDASLVSLLTGIISIDTSAFEGCKAITALTLPASITSLGNPAQDVFRDCTGLTTADLSSLTLHTIGNSMFLGCTALETVSLPNGLTGIGASTFADCSALTTVIWTDTDTNCDIGRGTFQNCTSLISITIPEGVTKIAASSPTVNYSTFAGCTGLISVTLPTTLTTIVAHAFSGCTNLETVILKRAAPAPGITTLANVSAFTGTKITAGTGHIYVPDGTSETAYEAANVWKTLTNYTTMIAVNPDL
jgi:uncharacterized repeat protein (TIGR02543 family)